MHLFGGYIYVDGIPTFMPGSLFNVYDSLVFVGVEGFESCCVSSLQEPFYGVTHTCQTATPCQVKTLIAVKCHPDGSLDSCEDSHDRDLWCENKVWTTFNTKKKKKSHIMHVTCTNTVHNMCTHTHTHIRKTKISLYLPGAPFSERKEVLYSRQVHIMLQYIPISFKAGSMVQVADGD